MAHKLTISIPAALFEELKEAALELAEYASYAEIVGGVRENREHIRKWCDEVFRINRAIDEVYPSAQVEEPTP